MNIFYPQLLFNSYFSQAVISILTFFILISILFSFYLLLANVTINNIVSIIVSLAFLFMKDSYLEYLNASTNFLNLEQLLAVLVFLIGFLRFIPLVGTDEVEIHGFIRVILVLFVTPLFALLTYLLPFNILNNLTGFNKARFIPIVTTLIVSLIYHKFERQQILKEY